MDERTYEILKECEKNEKNPLKKQIYGALAGWWGQEIQVIGKTGEVILMVRALENVLRKLESGELVEKSNSTNRHS